MATARVSAGHLTHLRTRAVTSGLDGVHMTSQVLIELLDEIDEYRSHQMRGVFAPSTDRWSFSEQGVETIRHGLNAAKRNLAARGTSLFEIEAALDLLPPKRQRDALDCANFEALACNARDEATVNSLRAFIRKHFTPKETDR